MEGDLNRVLRGLEAEREFASSYRFEMTDDYLSLLAQVEALPGNQPGADKSHVCVALRAYVDSFKRVERVPRR